MFIIQTFFATTGVFPPIMGDHRIVCDQFLNLLRGYICWVQSSLTNLFLLKFQFKLTYLKSKEVFKNIDKPITSGENADLLNQQNDCFGDSYEK